MNTGEYMVLIHNIDKGIKESTQSLSKQYYQSILILGGYHKMRESLYTRVTTLNMIFSVTYYLDLHSAISSYN